MVQRWSVQKIKQTTSYKPAALISNSVVISFRKFRKLINPINPASTCCFFCFLGYIQSSGKKYWPASPGKWLQSSTGIPNTLPWWITAFRQIKQVEIQPVLSHRKNMSQWQVDFFVKSFTFNQPQDPRRVRRAKHSSGIFCPTFPIVFWQILHDFKWYSNPSFVDYIPPLLMGKSTINHHFQQLC